MIKQLRLERGWSQEQLAEMTGLSVRTIQRAENGGSNSLETLKSLAAVFDMNVANLSSSSIETKTEVQQFIEEQIIREQVRREKRFYSHLMTFVIVISALAILNYVMFRGHYWIFWVLFGWGIGIIKHAIRVFEPFKWGGNDWEQKQVEKRMKNRGLSDKDGITND